MLSIIQAVIRDIDEWGTIFYNSSPEVELVIIDSAWSEERREKIKRISHNFKRVIYAPAKENRIRKVEIHGKVIDTPYDFLSAYNTGLAYAEEPLCMCMGGRNELHPDFFKNLKETIDNFGLIEGIGKNKIAIRPVEYEGNMGDVKWRSYIRYPQRYFILPCSPIGKEGDPRSIQPIVTCGFIIMNKDLWYSINGLDERYDVACGWWDNELLDRLFNNNITVIVDQKLIIYRYPHISAQPPKERALCKIIYDETKKDKNKRAPNPFNLDELHEKYMDKKHEYIL